MFRSLNNTFGKGVLGIILTGMGDDGVIGLKELFDNGAHTIAQDKESCVVFGMPQKAIEANGVKEVLSLRNIGTKVRQFALLNSNVCK
jgi:two-component system chemotaxis response regulator CheB